ncbi:MAG: NAD(P)/FAD-dependent oxidoreductase [Steroidobacteraceae bacterium]
MAPIHCDIAIIGAGVSGLIAARSLATSDRSVVVLEARNRVGGRVLTARVPIPTAATPAVVELGAEFIHGLPPESWTLLRTGGLATFELGGEPLRSANGRIMSASQDYAGSGSVLQRMQQWADGDLGTRDITFSEFLRFARIDGVEAQRAIQYVEGFNAADSQRISVASLAQQQRAEDAIQGERLFRLTDGYDLLPQFLRRQYEQAGGRVLLGHHVVRVEWQRSSARIQGTCAGGAEFDVRARAAVVTVPLGVLHAGSIDFAPAPGDMLVQAARMAMGSALRVTLTFESPFWHQDPALERMGFVFADDELPGVWWTASPQPAPTITGWSGGARSVAAVMSRAASGTGSDAMTQSHLEILARMLGRDTGTLQRLLVSGRWHNWDADEFSRGAYSFVPSGAVNASERMTEPVADTLFFAGEHTDTSGHWGTVHGALRSGLRAAAQLQRALT